LLKTVPMNQFIRDNGVEIVINGVRWDEHESRSSEDFFSPREDPDHARVHPILMINEGDVWEITWHHLVPATVSDVAGFDSLPTDDSDLPDQVGVSDIPVSPKYWKGFRSLGSEVSTDKSGEEPAWLQNLEETSERGGRAQNKDDDEIMSQLREAGYM